MSVSVWRPVLRLLSPGGGRGKLMVFIFHRVLEQHDPLLPGEPDGAQFDWMMRFVSRSFQVLPLTQAIALLRAGRLPAAAACLTFDDGYRDNFSQALPILRRYGLPATFFIATGFLGGGRMWNDDVIEAVRALPDGVVDWSEFGLDAHAIGDVQTRRHVIEGVLPRLKYFPHRERAQIAREIARRAGVSDDSTLMMSADEVRQLPSFGMHLGAHTHSHPILRDLRDDEAESEIARGKAELEAIVGETVDCFAYPNGNTHRDLGTRDARLVARLGFSGAVTTDGAAADIGSDPFLIPRFTPWDRTPHRFALRCALQLAQTRKAVHDVHH